MWPKRLSLLVPLAWYLGIAVLLPWLNGAHGGDFFHHAAITVVVATALFAGYVGLVLWQQKRPG